jgi:hypothetical protein
MSLHMCPEGIEQVASSKIVASLGVHNLSIRTACGAGNYCAPSMTWTDPQNHGSGELDPADGIYLNEFRIREGVRILPATKFGSPMRTTPVTKLFLSATALCWVDRGEWFNTYAAINCSEVPKFQLCFPHAGKDRRSKPMRLQYVSPKVYACLANRRPNVTL